MFSSVWTVYWREEFVNKKKIQNTSVKSERNECSTDNGYFSHQI